MSAGREEAGESSNAGTRSKAGIGEGGAAATAGRETAATELTDGTAAAAAAGTGERAL